MRVLCRCQVAAMRLWVLTGGLRGSYAQTSSGCHSPGAELRTRSGSWYRWEGGRFEGILRVSELGSRLPLLQQHVVGPLY